MFCDQCSRAENPGVATLRDVQNRTSLSVFHQISDRLHLACHSLLSELTVSNDQYSCKATATYESVLLLPA